MARKNKIVKHATRGRVKKKQEPVPSNVFTQQNILQEALEHHRAGQIPRAEALYRQILQSDPDHPGALLYLGVLANQVGKHGVAEELISRAIARKPGYVEALYNLGIVFLIQGKTAKAITAFRRVLALTPKHLEAINNLGNALAAHGSLEEAAGSYKQAITLNPDYAEAHYNLGNVLDDLARPEEAAISYKRAITLNPDYAEAHYNLGLIFQRQGRSDEAAASYRRVISLKPDYAAAHNNLGIIFKDQGKLAKAIACFRSAIALRQNFLEAYSNLLFCMNYLPSQSVTDYLATALSFGRQTAAMAGSPFTFRAGSSSPDRLRVGLVTDDFRNHPVGYFLENMLSNIDVNKIELIAYPISNKRDDLTNRIHSRFSDWRPLEGMDDKSVAQMIHTDSIHILLDLSGHTSNNRLPVFAWRPAPIQITWLGYVASTGMAEMDYILTDRVSIPESHQDNFTEQVWYLPNTRLCFSPPVLDEELSVASLPALHNGYITFGCFQNLAKLNDEVLGAWGAIFAEMPQARLRLQNSQFNSSGVRKELLERLALKQIDAERVVLEKAAPRKEYLAAHGKIDIILDTFPFAGGTTTCEALWMGVPTVTLAGRTMAGRQGASLLSCAGLTDWIAADPDEYVAKALSHAADLDRLSRLRAGLRQQVLASPLFDGPGFARNFEKAMWNMWYRFTENMNHDYLK